MGFGFGKNKRKTKQAGDTASTDITTKLDADGNVEIISKNFKMKPTPKSSDQPDDGADSTWICWGCGQPTDQDICPVCGKKRTK